MSKIVIAGGTGMIGQGLEKLLLEKNHEVFILTRNPKKPNHIAWDLEKKNIDVQKIEGTEYLINLCGESISGKRWTKKRKQELFSSRIGTNNFLFEKFGRLPSLKQFLSASGINCYPLEPKNTSRTESDAFGKDYLSLLVKDWEESADLFSNQVPVCKIRISMVLDHEQGALQKLLPIAKWGILSPLGTGQQWMSWLHIDDLASAFVFAIEHELNGAFNVTGRPERNSDFSQALLSSQGKRMFFPKVPSFLLKLFLGEQSTIVLDGALCDNSKLKNQGFKYKFETLESAFSDLFGK